MTESRQGSGPGTDRKDFERILMDIDAINGARRGGFPSRPVQDAPPAPDGEFARVFDIADARRRRMTGPDRIPDEVWEDITRAGQLAEDLAARGQHVRFDTHRLTGRVVATLCDSDGRLMRPFSLGEVLGSPHDHDPDPAPAA
jgi:hypothetical protein